MSIGVNEIAQTAVSGILIGGFFALASVGLSLTFGVQRILNVAHGAFVVLAAFVTIQFSIIITPILHVDPVFSLILDFLIVGLVGGCAYLLIIYKIETTGFEAPLLATFGLSVFLEYVIQFGLGPLKSLDPSHGSGASAQNTFLSGPPIVVNHIVFQLSQVLAFGIAVVLIPLLQIFLTRTYYGKAIRATAQDWVAAEFSGIDVRKSRLISFVLGSGLAGVAGGVFSFVQPVVPSLGDTYLLPIILAVIILGGVGSMIGTLIGGFIVGLLLNFSFLISLNYLSRFGFLSDVGNLITFLVFLIVLMVKPTGIFGQRSTT
jgi:branched-chain amino acid transport system permease protein